MMGRRFTGMKKDERDGSFRGIFDWKILGSMTPVILFHPFYPGESSPEFPSGAHCETRRQAESEA